MADHKRVMAGFGKSAPKASGPFWKRSQTSGVPGSVRPVFGAQHPPLQQSLSPSPAAVPSTAEQKRKKSNSKSSMTFDEFSHHIDDAWDVDEDGEDLPTFVRGDTGSVDRLPSLPVQTPTGKAVSSAGLCSTRTGPPRRAYSEEVPCSVNPLRKVQAKVSDHDLLRIRKFEKLIDGPHTPMDDLCKLSWSGIPHQLRHTIWQILSGYLPVNAERRKNTLDRKRKEYQNYVKQYFDTRFQPQHEGTFRQIEIDIPRMQPNSFFSQVQVQKCFERLLYIWSMRHPASGYVQGINDLAVPYFIVFLGSHFDLPEVIEDTDFSGLDESILDDVEADTFWCLSKLLDGIHDNYTCSQPGIQLKIHKLRELVKRIDAPLYQHLEANSVEFLQFAFRWMNNLLVREMPLQCILRLWDTYMCERDGFASFHPYVCAAFLAHWSKDLLAKSDFQELMLYLQKLPTQSWTEREISEILAAAWRWKYSFGDAPRHLH